MVSVFLLNVRRERPSLMLIRSRPCQARVCRRLVVRKMLLSAVPWMPKLCTSPRLRSRTRRIGWRWVSTAPATVRPRAVAG